MIKRVNVLCAVRDVHALDSVRLELDDEIRCAFTVVTSGRQAIESALQFVPDILVLDALLPDVDGLGVVDCLKRRLGSRMPRVIGGSMMPFCDRGFARRGVKRVLRIPWQSAQLRRALQGQMARLEKEIDWEAAQEDSRRAAQLLAAMGMHAHLKGFAYLSLAAALANQCEARLFAVREQLYTPIAQHCRASVGAVERLIRHAVESTMNSEGARSVYTFFGNTIDAARGKPTNAQFIAMLAQRLHAQCERERGCCEADQKKEKKTG